MLSLDNIRRAVLRVTLLPKHVFVRSVNTRVLIIMSRPFIEALACAT